MASSFCWKLMTVVIIDTSILCNLLSIPGKAQDREAVIADFEIWVGGGASLLLPHVAIYETANFIAQLGNGAVRRDRAEKFVSLIGDSLARKAPWALAPFPRQDEFLKLVQNFVDGATRGVGLVDQTIEALWHQNVNRHPKRRVLVWSADHHLSGYDSIP